MSKEDKSCPFVPEMSRKTNRDHAKKKQCPMVEERVIAEYLTTLLTPMMTSYKCCHGRDSTYS